MTRPSTASRPLRSCRSGRLTHVDADAAGGNAASKKKAVGSRSDGFGTTLGKTIIKSAVPAGTQIFENAIKRGAFEGKKPGGGGDGFTGIG